MLAQHKRGEVWIVDLGMQGRIRPCVILSVAPGPNDRELVMIVPHTTSTRGSDYEISIPLRYLKQGAFDVQNLSTVVKVRLIRRLGALTQDQLGLIEGALRKWLDL